MPVAQKVIPYARRLLEPKEEHKQDEFPELCLKKSRGLGLAPRSTEFDRLKIEMANLQFLRFSSCTKSFEFLRDAKVAKIHFLRGSGT